MPRSKQQKGKQQAATTATASKGVAAKKTAKAGIKKKEKVKHKERAIFEPRPRNFAIGGDLQPRRDLTRFVRWPKYVKVQRQRQVLLKRLKVPPAVNQFTHTLSKGDAKTLFSLLDKYRPETKLQKKTRRLAKAKEAADAKPSTVKPFCVKYGLNHVTTLVERRDAKLVIIAHDVDPLELVLWLPTLCRKKDIPYLIVKSKSRLGKVVHKKTASVLALTGVEPKDQPTFGLLVQRARDSFNSRYPTAMRTYGGKVMGHKHRTALAVAEKRRLKKESKK
jgi:large subunit ribosomal protein L7Ae